MKRDLDLIRLILLDVEATSRPSQPKAYSFDHPDRDAVAVSLRLMIQRGLINAKEYSTFDSHPADWFFAPELTWEGADFLDSVRDEEIWRKTKEGAAQAGSFTFDLVKALAKGLIRKKIEHHTGVSLEL